MKDRLLDTNIICICITGKRTGNPAYSVVMDRFSKLGRAHVFISLMSVMEIEFGLAIGDVPTLPQEVIKERASIRAFLNSHPKVNINSDTAKFYVPLRAKVFELHGTREAKSRRLKEKKTHDLKDRVTDVSIGIDERDLLIVGTAFAGNFVLVTMDRKQEMTAIVSAARELEREGKLPRLDIEYWDKQDAPSSAP